MNPQVSAGQRQGVGVHQSSNPLVPAFDVDVLKRHAGPANQIQLSGIGVISPDYHGVNFLGFEIELDPDDLAVIADRGHADGLVVRILDDIPACACVADRRGDGDELARISQQRGGEKKKGGKAFHSGILHD